MTAPGVDAVASAVDREAAVGFVHVGTRSDPDLRYLTDIRRADAPAAFVFVPPSAERPDASDVPAGVTVCPTPTDRPLTSRPDDRPLTSRPDDRPLTSRLDDRPLTSRPDDAQSVPARVWRSPPASPPGSAAAAVLDAATGGTGTVLVPEGIPHAAAVRLEQAGYDLASTDAVAAARARKSDDERDRLRSAQRAAVGGATRAAELLATATPTDDGLSLGGEPLTASRLRREVNAALAAAGATGAGDTLVRGGAAVDADRPLPVGDPVVLRLAPRGPGGYRGALVRTFVVDGDGGWERRAHVAAEAALRAGRSTVAPGVAVREVNREVAAELAAFGFDAGGEQFVRGVGLSTDERPRVSAAHDLSEGNVLAIEPAVVDPDRGAVGLADLVAVTADGATLLASAPRTTTPGAY